MCHADCPYPPRVLTCLICRESYLYIYQLLSTQCPCHSVMWHTVLTASSSLSSATSSPFFILPWERESCPFFLGCHYVCFSTRSFGFLELFSLLSLQHLWPPLRSFCLLPGHHKNHLIWVGSSLMPPLSELIFECLWLPLMRSSLQSDCPENHLMWVDMIRTVPLLLVA
jgi:hypothetical protein